MVPLIPSKRLRFCLLFAVAISANFLFSTMARAQDNPGQDIHLKITSISDGNADTLWLQIDGGSDLGLRKSMKGYAVQVYLNKDRDYAIGRPLVVTKVNAGFSQAFVTVPKDVQKSTYLLPGDQVLFTNFLLPSATGANKDLQSLASYNIIFSDIYADSFFTQKQLLLHADKINYDSMITVMQKDIIETAVSLKKVADKPKAWTDLFDTGKFKGVNLITALEQTSFTDIESFLHFVLDFPGKYLGHKWKLNETYATWVINNMPWAGNKSFLARSFLKLPDEQIGKWVKENRYYYDSLRQYISTQIDNLVLGKSYDSAESLIAKSMILAEKAGDKNFLAVCYTNKAIIAQDKNGKQNAQGVLSLYQKAISLDSSYWAPYWYRSNFYADLEQYKNAIADAKVLNRLFPYYANAWGNPGWWCLKQFKIKEAGPYCLKAYELDSFNMAWSVNLAHYYLLSGNSEKARRYYQKTLDNLKTTNDFINGPLSDFEFFAESGIMANAFDQEKQWMLEQYNSNYKHYVQADSLYALAKDQRSKGNYVRAAELFYQSREEENAAAKKRELSIHNISTWIGYCYVEAKDYKNAETFYQQALQMSKEKFPAQLSNDMDLLSELYQKQGNKALADALTSQAAAWKTRYEEEDASGDLYIISIGVNKYRDVNYQWAASDAEKVEQAFEKNGKKFAHIYARVFTNENAISDSIDKAIQRIVVSSKEHDSFVFYFTGKASENERESFLLPYGVNAENDSALIKKAISAELLRSWSNSISAKHQLFLLDAPAHNFSSAFASQPTNYSHSKVKDMLIISATFPRIEETESGMGVIAGSVLKIFSDSSLAIEKNITAKKFESSFANEITTKNYFLALESFSQGRDFVIAENQNTEKTVSRGGQEAGMTEVITRGGDVVNENTSSKGFVINKKYGLFIATDSYADPKWPGLNNPILDAKSLKKVLEDEYGFEIEVVTNPTKTQIYRKIDEYTRKKFDPNDQLVILFSGHGYFDSRRNEGYLVTSDAKYTDLDFDINYYPMSSLKRDLLAIPAKHIMVLMDACHGGAICEGGLQRGNEEPYSGVSLNDVLKQHLEQPNRIILTSGRKDQSVPDGIIGKNSPFMFGILHALESENAKKLGYVSYHDLVSNVDYFQKQSQSASGTFSGLDNNHFIFFYQPKKSAGIDPNKFH